MVSTDLVHVIDTIQDPCHNAFYKKYIIFRHITLNWEFRKYLYKINDTRILRLILAVYDNVLPYKKYWKSLLRYVQNFYFELMAIFNVLK